MDTGEAPWGVNPSTGRPYTKSPEERAAIGANLAAARQAKAAAKQEAVAAALPDPQSLSPIDRSTPDREPGDRPPTAGRRRGRRRAGVGGPPKAPVDVPPFRSGPIAKGMNRIYAKTGRLLKMANPMVGEAFISITRKESEDDETIGEAWEALAQTDPVWRARLLKLCSGGAYGRIVIAHLPILMALMALEPVKKRIPFGRIVEALLGGDATEPEQSGPPQGFDAPMSFEDMAAMASQMMPMMNPAMMQRFAQQATRAPAADETAEAA